MVGNILKWGCGTLLVVVALIVIVGIAGAILLPDLDKDQSPKEPHEEVLNPKEEPVRKPEPKEEPKSAEVEADARAYYDAQCPAIVCNAGNRKPFIYAGFANSCNVQQPQTAHS